MLSCQVGQHRLAGMSTPSSTAWWRRLRPDTFLLMIIAMAIIGTLLPVHGVGATIGTWVSRVTVAVLFFLYGTRLERREAINGLKHWRLHSVILSCTYIIFPIIGIALRPLSPGLIDADLYRGLLWICVVPGTVQSAVNFTSIARGNIAGAVVSSSMSNLLGVIATPLLAMLLMRTTGLVISASSILDVVGQIMAPFILGQLLRRWCADFVLSHPKLKYFDQITIAIVVYLAFASAMTQHVWSRTNIWEILLIVAIDLVILAFMLWLTWHIAGWLKFNRRDQIAIQFCGTKKSLTSGVPMAYVMFGAATVGFIVLPLMIFHQAQLMACSALAGKYASRDDSWHDDGDKS